MQRRELLKMITVATGAAMVGGNAMFTWAAGDAEKVLFNAEQRGILEEVSETILPRTQTPGAKDAKVAEFMEVFVRDCYTEQQRAIFLQGVSDIQARSDEKYGRSFMEMDANEREELIAVLDKEALAELQEKGIEPSIDDETGVTNGFTLIKQLTLFGFFTSKVGATEVLSYVAVPGRYDGDLTYQPGEPAWAT
ncbi:gluconate 2-dehydrogenase subunit 3 family protein [Halomonas binhaiensis]|uniref:Gluconate 2-dehydrogenase subunit 3 family protein n=1 Tax=Halomonas binhaiensis TaxID=2562282 RepID=A0A5C1NG00_9GAMM|nr:gluconate 2-dehydrogenase subunit 3 family protein [Halomonas binhaiensis]QEM81791.1 gluconate 2-dehydrogenase subunit 3 family protein [Halomonas binhaiensis]